MITTAALATEIGIKQSAIQKRLKTLGITPEKAGKAFVLTTAEANKVRNANDRPGPKVKTNEY
jgi:hypothetical protein